ncbi:MAG: hypothetical protein KUA43_03780 [Hoeflea sp.]|uniref:hypothetical protein n=1 Tax=Hoeflea sp. TaxID=1940281 RepID=UPI001DB018DA|nr:hypothetical protein [Hoeflea sp.]MBU4528227.1 hypothetical protein [Alphaproteobacteria bacterium]MBU4543823.1 hypothetical protein [Alphaproteobacteria bacterium]MBU4548464.1 hypothetical protein [Alphaproteobacteria bacterium]MBV1722543.1 hypothetical protein [Hoeflea sp.]MBV1762212.1 hypothetical protein [Hoeflea sp.]
MKQGAAIHRLLSMAIAIAVPAVAYAVNDRFDMEFIVLGAVIGLAYWYWGPSWPPL